VLALAATLFVAGSLRFFLGTRQKDHTPEIRIGVDGRYHWAYLTSLVLDRDLYFENQYADPQSGNYYRYERTATGRLANPFPIGPALAWAPFFLVAHGAAAIAKPERAAEGSSYLHQYITLYASFLMAFGAGVFAYRIAKRRLGAGPAFAGAVGALVAGPLLQYTINQPSYAHAPSAFFVAALFDVWDAGRGQARGVRGWVLLGALLGAATLMRTQNAVFAVPLLGEGAGLAIGAFRREGIRAAGRALVHPLAGAGVALLVFFPQMWAWKILYGHWLGVPRGRATCAGPSRSGPRPSSPRATASSPTPRSGRWASSAWCPSPFAIGASEPCSGSPSSSPPT